MAGDLENNKTKKEIEKLDAEIWSLRHPFSKPSSWVPIFLAVAGIFSAVAQWQISDFKKERAALEADKKLLNINIELKNKSLILEKYKIEIEENKIEIEENKIEIGELNKERNTQLIELSKLNRDIRENSALFSKIDSNVDSGNIENVKNIIEQSKVLNQKISKELSEILNKLASTGINKVMVEKIINACEEYGVTNTAQIAYILATVQWDSAQTFTPTKEAFWLSEE